MADSMKSLRPVALPPEAAAEAGAHEAGSEAVHGRGASEAELGALIDRTLKAGFPWLRFPAGLEARFRQDTAAARLKTLVIAGTLVAFLINGFLPADHAMLPDVFEHTVRWRTWFFTPLVLGGTWLLSRLPFPMLRELLASGAAVLACFIHVYLASISHSEYAAAYMIGLAVVVLFVNIFVRTRFWLALLGTGLVGLSFIASLWLVRGHTPALSIPIGLVILSSSTFTLYYLYTLEHEERLNYLLALRQRLLQRELKQANQQLEHVSRHDALTQVANRRHFDEVLGRVWERARGQRDRVVSVVIVDVDHFKAYNDRYGHPAGDACLVRVAAAMRDSLRRPGDLVARYGGEEFIAVLPGMSATQALAAADRVRAAIEALDIPHEASFTHGRVTASLGVATLLPADRHASAQRLIALADEALYQAKNRGRNQVWAAAEPAARSA